ncbi:MAG TPA: hypothetical protein VGN84_08630 [Solirubrobacterales bacterium]|jgi:hypothetical protein|nr:hypothetical protein [Solirubrobacterales bacterium]
MRLLRTAVFALLFAGALAFASGAGAALIGIYRNSMESKSQLAQVVKLSGKRCGRSGSDGAFLIVVGKETKECSYRTPVLGRDLEIAATETLLSKTPKPIQRSAYLSVDLRAGGGARYQLAVYPLQRKAQVRKVLADGTVEYLAIEKNLAGIGGADKANQLRLQALNVTSGDARGNCQLLAFIGGKLVAEATDEGAGDLTGRASGFSVGSAKSAKGAQASVDDVVVRVPSPF